jgi:hypothetical protein
MKLLAVVVICSGPDTVSLDLVPKQAYAGWHESPQGSRRLGAQQARLACQAVMCFPWLSLFHAPFSFHNI